MPQVVFEGNQLNTGLEQKRLVSVAVCLFSIHLERWYVAYERTGSVNIKIYLNIMYAYVTPHTHTFRAEVLTGQESAMPGDLQHAFENHLSVAPSRGPGHTVQAWHQVGVPGGLREARWLTEVSRAKGQVLASCFLKVARAKLEKMNWHHDHKGESTLERSGRKCVQKHSRSQEESEKIQGTDSSGSRCVWGASWFHFQLLDANAQQGHVLPFTLSLHLAKEVGKASPESHRHCGLSSPGGG